MMNIEDKKLTDTELASVSGGTLDASGHQFPVGTQVLQTEFPQGYKGSNKGYVSELLPEKRYRVMWDNGYDGDTYSEAAITRMQMHWDIMYGA